MHNATEQSVPSGISVVIPVFNHASVLPRCLDALLSQADATDCFEVIVVNDGSTDDLPSVREGYSQEPRIRWLDQQNQGPGVARNLGIGAAQFNVIALTDADCLPAPNWLKSIQAALAEDSPAHPRPDAVGGIIDNGKSGFFADLMHLLEFGDYYSDTEEQRRMLPTANLALRRQALESIGGFARALRISEDVDLGWRLTKAGFRIHYIPEIRIRHFGIEAWSDILKKQVNFGRYFLRARRAHPDLPLQISRNKSVFFLLLPAYILGSAVRSMMKSYARKLGTRLILMAPLIVIARSYFWFGVVKEMRET